MTNKEKKIQIALGSYPTWICPHCSEETYIDEIIHYSGADIGTKNDIYIIITIVCPKCKKIHIFTERKVNYVKTTT